MKLSKMQHQSKINFVDSEEEFEQIKQKENIKDAPSNDSILNQMPKKTNNNDLINSTRGSGILSAGVGTVSDMGGPNKYQGSQTNNSIWDSNILDELVDVKGNDEKIKEEKQAVEKLRKGMRKEALDQLAKSISETDTRKDATVVKSSEYNGSSYQTPKTNMSIFDADFSNLPEETEGEKISKRANAPKEKDESWKSNGLKNTKTSELINSLFL